MSDRAAKLILASVILLYVLFLALLMGYMDMKGDIQDNKDGLIRGRNERLTYQNEERGLTCRILGAHDRNDPLCSVAPSTTVPMD